MRILILHNCYQISSGEEAVVKAEQTLLRAKGHTVEVLEVNNNGIEGFFDKAKAAMSVIYSQSSKRLVKSVISQFTPDIIHIHNFFPLLSPSIYFACNEAGIPVVQTLHNYRLLCASALLYRDGKICEDCLGKPFGWPGVVHSCYRGNKIGSASVSAMSGVHRLLGTWENRVDAYICLTEFSRKKFIQGGLPEEKLFVKPNFVYSDLQNDYEPEVDAECKLQGEAEHQPYFLYVGRLSPEKGIEALLSAWKLVSDRVHLKIVGEGPLGSKVAEVSAQTQSVEWLGRQPSDTVRLLMKQAIALIFPSIWYEPMGLTIIEAFSVETPVIASKIGAVAEIVRQGHNGLHFSPGNINEMVSQIKCALNHPAEMARMGRSARADFEEKYTAEKNYHQLISIYKKAITAKRGIVNLRE